MTAYRNIYLRRKKDESLQRLHPWVFSGAIDHADAGVEEGDVVRVLSADGDYIATGHYQQGTITVRVLSFADEEIDAAFWRRRLATALDVRRALGIAGGAQSDAFRLVHGEGDSLPGLVVDCYGDTAVVQAHSIGMHRSRKAIADALLGVMAGDIKNVYYKSDTTLHITTAATADGSMVSAGAGSYYLHGAAGDCLARENGLRFYVDWLRGQKTGFFVDQRDNRQLLERYARGRRVLNMFCYTGGFSVYALRGGAELVHSVDSSAKAVELTERNVALNFPGDARHAAYCEDAFRFLDHSDGQYDLIILDPPAFAKHRGALHNALKGYTRLNVRGFERIRPGGILFTFSCSQVVTKDQFRAAVFTAALQAGRRVRILHQLHQPADHPIDIYHPEGEYLKGLVLYVE